MKKSTKIFAIVLTLALVLGVFAVGALAAGVGHDYGADVEAAYTGETVVNYLDFENHTAGVLAGTGDIAAPFKSNMGKGITLAYKTGNSDLASIVSASKGDANQSLKLSPTATTGQAFIGLTTGNGYTGKAEAADFSKSMANNNYHVIDFDVFFPEGAFPRAGTRPTVDVHFRLFKADGTAPNFISMGGYANNTASIYFHSNYSNTDVPQVYHNYSGWSLQKDMAKDQWTHFTYVIESLVNDNGTPDIDTDDYLDLTFYTFMNGIMVYEYTPAAPDGSLASAVYNNDLTGMFLSEIRLGIGAADAPKPVQYDNIAVRAYNKDYVGNLASIVALGVDANIANWDRNVYDPADMPMGNVAGAKIGDVEYPNLAAAIKAAPEGGTIELAANSDLSITVDKAITINKNSFTVTNLSTADGYGINDSEEAVEITKANNPLTVVWIECECGEGCIEEIETEVYPGNNIFDSYFKATGKMPVCQGIQDGLNFTIHTGDFEDQSGLLELVTSDMVATDDMMGETIELYPAYAEDTALAVIEQADGTENYIFGSAGFNTTSFAAAKEGATIKLLTNVKTTAAIGINVADLTVDLNGFRIETFTKTANGESKYPTFQPSRANFTIMSSKVGGAIYNGCFTGSGTQGNAVVQGANNNASTYIDGANDAGEVTVSFYCAMAYQNYGVTAKLTVDGGRFIGTGADSMGLFMFKVMPETGISFNNAYIYGGNALFCFSNSGRKVGATVEINNCVLDGTKSVVTGETAFEGLNVTFDGCYINGNIVPGTKHSYDTSITIASNQAAAYVLKNCFIAEGRTINAVAANGQEIKSVNTSKTFDIVRNDYSTNAWTNGDVIATTTTPTAWKFDRMVADIDLAPVDVIWYAADGETIIAQNTAMPGTNAAAPATVVEGTDGMIAQSYVDWDKDTYIPLGTTGTVEFTLKEGAAVQYVAGKVDVMFNFDLINHMQYTHYIPVAPEGITYKSVSIAGGAAATLSETLTDPATGKAYYKVNSWPGIRYADDEKSCTVVYEYQGQEFTYNAPTASAVKYIKYVLGAEKYDNMPEFKTAMADLVRAMMVIKAYEGKTPSAALTALNEIATPYMSDAATAIDKTKTADYSAIAEYVDNVYADFTDFGGATIAVDVKDGYAALVKIPGLVHGYAAAGETRTDANGETGLYVVHNVRTYGYICDAVIEIYNVGDVSRKGQIVNVNAGATPIATATVNAEGLMNADTDADAATTARYQAFIAVAKSCAEYMDWRQVWLGKA